MTEEYCRQDKTLSGKTDKEADESDDKKTDFPKNPNRLKRDYRQGKTLAVTTDKQTDGSDDKRPGFPENPNLLKTIIGKTSHCLGRLIIILTFNNHSKQLWLKEEKTIIQRSW